MSKIMKNLIKMVAIIAFVLGPVAVSPAFARISHVDSGVIFYPAVENTTTVSTSNNTSSNTSNTPANTSQNSSSSTSNTSQATSTSNNSQTANTSSNTTTTTTTARRTISLTDGVSNLMTTSNQNYGNYGYASSSYNTPNDINSEYRRLTASAVMGSNGFWPSGIYQWIIMFILILLIITTVRYIRRSKVTYMNSPLKHA